MPIKGHRTKWKVNGEFSVREWVAEASGGKARWVEPAIGSTPGLPDCWVPIGGRCMHLELKAGRISDGVLRYKVRAPQVKEMRSMVEDRVPVGLLIGVIDTGILIVSQVNDSSLAGSFEISSFGSKDWLWLDTVPAPEKNFRSLVNFIISDVRFG